MAPRSYRSGLVLALLAMIAQLAVGGFVPSSADLFAMRAVPICQGGTQDDRAPPPQHRPDVLPSPFCTALFAGAVQLPAAPSLPAPLAVALPRPELPPPATAPPAPARLAAQPRGPPAFLA